MKMMLFIFFAFACFLNAAQEINLFVLKDSSVVQSRVKQMSSIFPELSWNKPGLYLFVEKRELRLFYLNSSGKIQLYQYPSQKESKWLNPEKYLEERKLIESRKWDNKCRTEIIIDRSVMDSIFSLHIESIPYFEEYVFTKEKKKTGYMHGENFATAYLGYLNDEKGTHLFFVRPIQASKPPISLLMENLERFALPPFDFKIGECK